MKDGPPVTWLPPGVVSNIDKARAYIQAPCTILELAALIDWWAYLRASTRRDHAEQIMAHPGLHAYIPERCDCHTGQEFRDIVALRDELFAELERRVGV